MILQAEMQNNLLNTCFYIEILYEMPLHSVFLFLVIINRALNKKFKNIFFCVLYINLLKDQGSIYLDSSFIFY